MVFSLLFSRYEDGWDPDNWEAEMENHPFFAKGVKEGQELPPLLKGIQVNKVIHAMPSKLKQSLSSQ